MLEAVPAEAHSHVNTLDARHLSHNRVPVGGDVVRPGPPAGELRARESGHPPGHKCVNAGHMVPIHLVGQRIGILDWLAVVTRAD